MSLLHGQSKYADIMEYLIYNTVISGVSLKGNEFFYRNLLESTGNYYRREWIDPPCCPTSIVRFLPEIGSLIYAKDNNAIYVNHFIGNEANIQLKNEHINLKMQSNYPWEGNVTIRVSPENTTLFKLHVRIPGWTSGEFIPGSDLYSFPDASAKTSSSAVIKLNGALIDQPSIINGYLVIEKKWTKGDQVTLDFPMKSHAVFGHPAIKEIKGKVALMRGPIVYCMEEADNPAYFTDNEAFSIKYDSITGEFDNDLLGGLVKLKCKASNTANQNMELTYIPYYSWANRENGKMMIWAPYK
jgi:DUF1680 family protein